MADDQQSKKGIKLVAITKAPALPDFSEEGGGVLVDPTGQSLADNVAGVVLKSGVKVSAFLQNSFNLYRGRCECGASYDNNCAHFLTDAMVRAGLPRAFPANYAKCSKGRLIRAKECLAWFRGFSTGFNDNHNNLGSGYWFVYQEYQGQGHVCIHLEAPDKYWWRGTTDLPNWPVQWHYFY